ncbi:MAG: aminomethyl-transferring glycine dehydrogenase subunit GcvPA [Candidatus Margulisiibacteriota bacterium]
MNYIPNTDSDRKIMLEACGFDSLQALFPDIPKDLKNKCGLSLPKELGEMDLSRELKALSRKNKDVSQKICFLGAGAYNHFIPSVVKHIISRSEFYTAYTPYQPEISQGILQAIYEYQTMICRLTGMNAANASMYDGATAMAEAALLCASYTKRKEILVSGTVNPLYRQVLSTYAVGAELILKEAAFKDGITHLESVKKSISGNTACVIIQQPNFFGCLEKVFDLAQTAHENGALFAASVDPISLAVLNSPSEYGADVVVGEGQSLGNPLNFGGPYLGIFASKKQFLRYMPGRLVGKTRDSNGKPGYVLTLQTREQHIRRGKATSNICTNEALCALAACVYMTVMGGKGLRSVAQTCTKNAASLKDKISKIKGFSIPFNAPCFKEFVIKTPRPAEEINKKLSGQGIIGGLDLEKFYPGLKNHMLLCATEMNSPGDIEKFAAALRNV